MLIKNIDNYMNHTVKIIKVIIMLIIRTTAFSAHNKEFGSTVVLVVVVVLEVKIILEQKSQLILND